MKVWLHSTDDGYVLITWGEDHRRYLIFHNWEVTEASDGKVRRWDPLAFNWKLIWP